MKKLYQSPEVEIVDFVAAEKLAALELSLEPGDKSSTDIPV